MHKKPGPLARHDAVRIQDSNPWTKRAPFLEEVSPRSYNVRTEDGQTLSRNRRSLLKTQERLQEQPNETAMEDSADTASAETPPATYSSEPAEQNGLPVLRRSTRSVKPPDRLRALF